MIVMRAMCPFSGVGTVMCAAPASSPQKESLQSLEIGPNMCVHAPVRVLMCLCVCLCVSVRACMRACICVRARVWGMSRVCGACLTRAKLQPCAHKHHVRARMSAGWCQYLAHTQHKADLWARADVHLRLRTLREGFRAWHANFRCVVGARTSFACGDHAAFLSVGRVSDDS